MAIIALSEPFPELPGEAGELRFSNAFRHDDPENQHEPPAAITVGICHLPVADLRQANQK